MNSLSYEQVHYYKQNSRTPENSTADFDDFSFILVKDCGDPGNLHNGVRKDDGNTTYGSKVRYFCNPGYIFSGSRERKCQADGKWSGTQPVCNRKSSL